MEITIIGTGQMARGIGTRAIAGGHQVAVIGTDRSKAEALAGELGGGARAVEGVTGDAVVLAVYYGVLGDVLTAHDLGGRVVVDISNPLDAATSEPIVPEAGSAAQEIAARVPGARVVKAFNTVFAGTLAAGQVADQPIDVFLASDDDDAKAIVRRLVEDGGLRAVDAGPLRRARELEALGYLHIVLQEPLGTGFSSAVKIIA